MFAGLYKGCNITKETSSRACNLRVMVVAPRGIYLMHFSLVKTMGYNYMKTKKLIINRLLNTDLTGCQGTIPDSSFGGAKTDH